MSEVRMESDNAHPTIRREYKRGVHKSIVRAHIRNVSHSQLVRTLGFEFTLDQVWAQIRQVRLSGCDW